MSNNQHLLSWPDLKDCVAILSPLVETVDQACVLLAGHPAATIFLPHDGILASVEITVPPEIEPPDTLLLAIGRTIVAHKHNRGAIGEFACARPLVAPHPPVDANRRAHP